MRRRKARERREALYLQNCVLENNNNTKKNKNKLEKLGFRRLHRGLPRHTHSKKEGAEWTLSRKVGGTSLQ